MVKQNSEKLPLFDNNLRLNCKVHKRYLQEIKDAKREPKKFSQNCRKRLTLSWHNITAYLKAKHKFGAKSPSNEKPKCILSDVSGAVEAGGFLAIMGVSGSGKTTLLNVLTNRNLSSLDVVGKVKLNGHVVGDDVMHHCAYVQQDDLLRDFLTVREHLTFQAMLRMDQNLSYEERMLRVENTIDELNLTSCADTRIGIPGSVVGISGGERRKLAFAMEVLANPSIIVCDEPTSGLDSYSSANVITVLKKISERGRTVIFTVHQPSSEVYELFDKIILMAIGRVAYMGHKAGAVSFFENMKLPLPVNFSPPDFFIYNLAIMPQNEQECIDKVNIICDIFGKQKKERQHFKVSDLSQVSKYEATWIMQMKMLLWRSFKQLRHEYSVAFTGLALSILVTLTLTALFYGQQLDQKGILNINGVICLLLLQMCRRSQTLALYRFCSEWPLFLREHRNGIYRADVYFLCITIYDLPVVLTMVTICASLFYHAIGLNSESSAFWIFLLTLVLSANASLSFGYMISCIYSSLTSGSNVGSNGTVGLIVLQLCSGLFLNDATAPGFILWIKYLSHYYYGFQILMINQWRNIGNITCEFDAVSCIHDGKGVLESMNSKESELFPNFIGLAGLIVFYRIIAFLIFYIKSRRQS